jgi:hypothetical protein
VTGRDRLDGLAAPGTSDPDTDLGVLLRHIQPGTAGMNHFHEVVLLSTRIHADPGGSTRIDELSVAGGPGRFEEV